MLAGLRFAGDVAPTTRRSRSTLRGRPRARGAAARTWSRRPARARRCSASRSCAGSARPRSCSRRTRRSRRSGSAPARRSARPRGSWPPRRAPPSPASPTRRSRGSRIRARRCAAPPRRAGSPSARRRRRSRRRRSPPRPRRGPARPRAGARASWRGSRRRSSARSRAAARRGGRCGSPTCSRPGARARVDVLRAGGVRTVVLDECHHLASLWGYVVRAVLEELGGDVHVVGLTATPPDELTTQEAELYAALLGPVDFQVPTPAVVRDGFLAPYQELAWLTEPLGRRAAVARRARDPVPRAGHRAPRRRRGRAARPRAVGRHAAAAAHARATTRPRSPGATSSAAIPRSPPPGVRFLGSAGLPLPPGAPRGEAYRRAPDLADWVVLLEDWVLRCLDRRPPRRPRRAARRSPPRCATSATT